MKAILTLLFVLLVCIASPGQVCFVNSSDDQLFKFDASNCSLEFITTIQQHPFDIAFHQNGKLYGISRHGNLYEIDLTNGAVNYVHKFEDPPVNEAYTALTISENGELLTTGSHAEIWSYDPVLNIEKYYGNMYYPSSGDLTFYQGQLYSGHYNKVVQVNLEKPQESKIITDHSLSSEIWGLINFGEKCDDLLTLAFAVDENGTKVYKMDIAADSSALICSFDLQFPGVASPLEGFGSQGIIIDEIIINHPSCQGTDGSINIITFDYPGAIKYSIDGINFQSNPFFGDLVVGEYIIHVVDGESCPIIRGVVLGENLPYIDLIDKKPATCGEDNAGISVAANGGHAPYLYSIDNLNFTTDGNFDNLTAGNYTIYILDDKDCPHHQEFELDAAAPISIDNLVTTPTSCGENNGELRVITDYQGLALYTINGASIQDSELFLGISPGSYLLQAIDENNCTDSMAFAIADSEKMHIDELIIQAASCGQSNGQISIRAEGGNGILTYSINDEIYNPQPHFDNLSGGDYDLFILDELGCQLQESLWLSDTPVLKIEELSITPPNCGKNDGRVKIHSTGGSGNLSYSLDGITFTSGTYIDKITRGDFTLILQDEVGCTSKMNLQIYQDCPFYIPNVFSPNGDNKNDEFKVFPHPEFDGEFLSLRLFDRWGAEIYRQDYEPNRAMAWDGRSRGVLVGDGVYTYMLEVKKGVGGELEMVTGAVSVLR